MSFEQAGFLSLLKESVPGNNQSLFFHRFIGIENNDEESYFENMYLFFDYLQENHLSYELVQKGLDSFISDEHTNTMNRFWTTVTKLKEPASKTIVGVTFGYRNKPLINQEWDDKVKEALAKTLDLFRENQNSLDVIKNFYFSLTFWVETYLPKFFSNNETHLSPKAYIYWGKIKRNEAYFLYFLSLLPIQVIYINPSSEDGTGKINSVKQHSSTHEWKDKKNILEVPKRVGRTKTVAAKAQREIHEVLHTDSSGIYKPWQFEHYETKTVPLQTTLEELFILWNEPAKFRTGFEVKNKIVHIPNIFAKISGVPEEIDKYLEEYHLLKNVEHIILADGFPLSANTHYHKQNIVLKNGRFENEDIKRMREYDFHHLRSSIQDGIAETINELISDEPFFVNIENKKEFPYMVLHTILRMNSQIVTCLQTFDYGDQIPKVVIFDGKKSVFSMQDAILLGFLHKIGFDVMVLTPTGYQNMERYIDTRLFDHHKREKFVFDLEMDHLNKQQRKSWFDKWFK